MSAPTMDPVSQRIVGIATVTTLEFPKYMDAPPPRRIRSHRRPSATPLHVRRAAAALATALVLVGGMLGLSLLHGGPGPSTPPPVMYHP